MRASGEFGVWRAERGRFGLLLLALALLGCSNDNGQAASGSGASASANRGARGDTSALRAPHSASRKRLVFVGTSLTAGLGLDPDSAYPQLIARKVDSLGLPYEVVNAGVSGETSAGLLQRLDWLLRGPIDVLVLETGANDGLRGLPTAELRKNVQQIIDRSRRAHPQARIFLVQMEAPPNLGREYTTAFRDLFPELARANGIGLLPFLLENVAGNAELNQPDGIHPNVEGERIVAENVWRGLAPALDPRLQAR